MAKENETSKYVEPEYDPDAKQTTWDEWYKIIYKSNNWNFWGKFNYENLKRTYTKVRRIYAPIIINEKYPEFNQYPKFKMSGDTDFNFGKNKEPKQKYEKFEKLLRRDYSGNELKVHLDKLKECNVRYHDLGNFSFMPMTGGLQLVKGSCEYDRLDVFVYKLSNYYETEGRDKYILSRATISNRESLKIYLKLFDSIYDYCAKICMINCDEFVNKIIAQGKESIYCGERVVRYMKLAEEFWCNKKEALKNT